MPRSTTRTKRLPTLSPDPPSPVAAPKKRSHDGMMAGKAKAANSPEQPPTKKSRKVRFNETVEQAAQSDPLEGPSITSRLRSNAVHDEAVRKGRIPPPSAPGGRDNPIQMNCPPPWLESAYKEAGLEYKPSRPSRESRRNKDHVKIAQLEAELKTVKAERDNAVLAARMDDLLERDAGEKKYAQLDLKYRRSLRRNDTLQTEIAGKTAATTALNEKLEALHRHIKALQTQYTLDLNAKKTEVRNAVSDCNYWRIEADHSQTLVRTMEEDFDDLRRLETENAARRKREQERTETLPPAYGSLDDEDRDESSNGTKVAVEEAEDGGKLEVATFKRTVRQGLMRRIEEANQEYDEYRHEVEGAGIDYAEPYMMITMALQEASQNIDNVIRRSGDVFVERIKACEDPPGSGNPVKLTATSVMRGIARQEYIADRAAKLLLDVSLKVLAALELHTTIQVTLSKTQMSEAGLAWASVDESLLHCLRSLFNVAASSNMDGQRVAEAQEKLFAMQYYLFQVRVLRSGMNAFAEALMVRVGNSFRRVDDNKQFDKTYEWLSEQIEIERMIVANSHDEEAADEDGADVDGVPMEEEDVAQPENVNELEEERAAQDQATDELEGTRQATQNASTQANLSDDEDLTTATAFQPPGVRQRSSSPPSPRRHESFLGGMWRRASPPAQQTAPSYRFGDETELDSMIDTISSEVFASVRELPGRLAPSGARHDDDGDIVKVWRHREGSEVSSEPEIQDFMGDDYGL